VQRAHRLCVTRAKVPRADIRRNFTQKPFSSTFYFSLVAEKRFCCVRVLIEVSASYSRANKKPNNVMPNAEKRQRLTIVNKTMDEIRN